MTAKKASESVDLAEVAKLVDQLERDLKAAREGSADVATLREEVERLRTALATREPMPGEVSDGLQGIRARMHALGDELFDDAVTTSRYAAWLGRILGL